MTKEWGGWGLFDDVAEVAEDGDAVADGVGDVVGEVDGVECPG